MGRDFIVMKTAHLPLELLESIVKLLHELPAKYSRGILNDLDAQVKVTDDGPPIKQADAS